MSSLTAALIVVGVIAAGLLLLALGLCRVGGHASRAEGAREETAHPVGPDSLRLLEDLDAHLDAHAAQLAGLYERLGPPDPARDAIRDHRTNTPEGD